jgi:signal transduction histidine kinase
VDHLKKELLRMFNHELRSPLTLIKGYVAMVEADKEELDVATLTQYLNGISRGSERLLELVDDILLVMEIEAGWAVKHFEDRKEPLDSLARLVSEAVEAHEDRASQRSVQLDVHVAAGLPPVCVDAIYLSDALSRLVDNAIKFSKAGGSVELSVDLIHDRQAIALQVADKGQGIPSAQLNKVFDTFHQVDRERHEQQGAGLGLAIAKGLVELHGGEIQVASEEGVGSTFSIFLPLEAQTVSPY